MTAPLPEPRAPRPIDLTRVRATPLAARESLVETGTFAEPILPGPWFPSLFSSIPRIHAGREFRALVEAIANARTANRPVVLAMGAHVIKVGLAPLVIDLLERNVVTAVAMNGAGAIHDFEIATAGKSSEDVGRGLEDGSFGMAKETAENVNGAAVDAARANPSKPGAGGFGAALGARILAAKAPHARFSILAACARLSRPATVHVALGSDIVHMHPGCDGAAIGAATLADFRTLAGVVADLSGGVFLNVGSAVILPEVFVKALNLARNVGHEVKDFVTANLDQIRHYRPRKNVLERPGGRAIELIGHHELQVPLLRLAVLDRLGIRSAT